MSKFEISILEPNEIEQINLTSLKVLEKVGVIVHHNELRSLLSKKGARVVGETVYLPKELIRECLSMSPSVITFIDRRGKELPLQEGNLVWGAGSTQYPWSVAVDGNRHPTRVDDAIKITKLVDALPRFDVIHLAEGPLEGIPEPLTNLHSIAIFFKNSHKHVSASPARVEDAQIWFDIAEISLGGNNFLREPVLSIAVSTTSPLQIDPSSAQILIDTVRRGIPVVGLSAPMAGGTTPVTLAGTLVLMNAELLFLLTSTQCVREASPFIYGGVGAVLNMRTGHISMGSPEFSIFVLAHAQIGRFNKLPTYAPINVTDSTRVDVQAGGEWVLQQFCGMLSKLNYTIIAPSVDNSLATTLGGMLLASDFIDSIERVLRGIVVNEDTLAFECISDVGPGHNFLASKHTLRFFRKEHYLGGSFQRDGNWGLGASALYRAYQRAEEIASKHTPDVPSSIINSIDRYVSHKSKQIIERQ